MDDLIMAGIVSLIGLYASTFLAAVVAGMVLIELAGAAIGGDPGRVAAIIAIALLFLGAYTGTGLLLRHYGRI